MLDTIKNFLSGTGVYRLISNDDWWKIALMFLIAFVLVYLAIVKKFEPLLVCFLPIFPGAECSILISSFHHRKA